MVHRLRIEVSLTEKGSEVFEQSLHNNTDERIMSVLTMKERKSLTRSLWKLRSRALQDLGIPEWHFNLGMDQEGSKELEWRKQGV